MALINIREVEILHGVPDLVDDYAQMAALDWENGYLRGSTPPEDIDKAKLAAYIDGLRTSGSSTQERFMQSIIAESNRQKDTLTVCYEARAHYLVAHGVMRWRSYSPEGVRGFIGRLKGVYPYLYAPDFFVSAREPEPVMVQVLQGAQRFHKSHIGTSPRYVRVDALVGNRDHQAMLEDFGFVAIGTQAWQTSELMRPMIGSVQHVRQFRLDLQR